MPMRQLLLLRHAKSSWDDAKLADFDRPLAPRGLKTAPLMGRELARRGWLPDLALVSPALRTRDTWRLVAAELPKHVPAEFAEELYEAAPAAILARVRQAKATSLIVIGHNPGLQNFVGSPAPDRIRAFSRKSKRSFRLRRSRDLPWTGIGEASNLEALA